MAPSPSHSRRGRSPRWISRGMNRRGNPPKRFHPFRHCARQSAIMGHPPGCGLPGALRRGGRIMGDTAADGNRCGRSPALCPILRRNRTGLSGSKKKKPYPYPNSPIPHIMPFSCFFLQKNAIFFFLRPRSPAASFPPLYAYGRKNSFIPVVGGIAEREKASGTFFLLKDSPLALSPKKPLGKKLLLRIETFPAAPSIMSFPP